MQEATDITATAHGALARVPVDVFDIIFALLQDDHLSLSSCTLTCKRWRDISLPHLFRAIKVCPDHSFSSFFEFIRHRPEIATHIRLLKLKGNNPFIVGPKLDYPAFASLLPTLNQLDTVFIGPGVVVGNLPKVCQPLPVGRLVVDVAHYNDQTEYSGFITLSALLCLFTPDTLQVRLPTIHSNQGLPCSPPPHLGPLKPHSVTARRIVLGISDAEQFEYLMDILDRRTLRHLTAYCGEWDAVTKLCDLLQVVGDSLESLDINIHPPLDIQVGTFSRYDWRTGTSCFFALHSSSCRLPCRILTTPATAPIERLQTLHNVTEPCRNLSTLRITLPYLIKDPYSRAWPPYHPREYPICRSLLSGAPRVLRTFTVCLMDFMGCIPPVHKLALWDLEELDQPWFRQRFPCIEHVVVELSDAKGEGQFLIGEREPGDLSSLQDAVMKTLPGLRDAGLLRVGLWNGVEVCARGLLGCNVDVSDFFVGNR